jgi:hypothetical protein
MSASGLFYMMNTKLQDNRRLAAYYDFSVYNAEIDPNSSGPYTGVVYNQFPAYDTGKYIATILSATGMSQAAVSDLITGAVSGVARMTESNIRIPRHELDSNKISAIFDFEWNGNVENCILLGSYDRFQEVIDSITVTGSKGFNFGVTDRGCLFFEAYKSNGPTIFSTSSFELSERNVVSVSVGNGFVALSAFDYFNNESYVEEFNFDANYIANPDYYYIGGAPRYYRTTGAYDTTISGNILECALFSGYLSSTTLKDISSGLIGDYYFTPNLVSTTEVVTGYSDIVTYKTGVTGVTLQEAGTLTVSTGRHIVTNSELPPSTGAGGEGDDTYVYYSYNNGQFTTSYEEKIGYLDPSNNYQYAPTGENAFDTLGLQTGSFTIDGSVEVNLANLPQTGSYKIYQKVEQTGILSEISGVVKTPLTKTVTGQVVNQSGIAFNSDVEKLKRDYIYYKGLRL